MTFGSSGTGTGMDNSIPEIREREGNGKNPFLKFGNGKGMKKSIPKVRERESEASILGNDREREFPLTPAWSLMIQEYLIIPKCSKIERYFQMEVWTLIIRKSTLYGDTTIL